MATSHRRCSRSTSGSSSRRRRRRSSRRTPAAAAAAAAAEVVVVVTPTVGIAVPCCWTATPSDDCDVKFGPDA